MFHQILRNSETNRKFLHKYVKTANSQWTALISSKKSGITTTYF